MTVKQSYMRYLSVTTTCPDICRGTIRSHAEISLPDIFVDAIKFMDQELALTSPVLSGQLISNTRTHSRNSHNFANDDMWG